MKILVATYGSRGDVQPIIALCLALRSAGHEVLLAAPPENRQWIGSLGLAFASLGDPFMAFAGRHPDVHSLRSLAPFLRFLREQTRIQFRTLPPLVRGVDLAIGCSLVFGLPSVAESLAVSYRYISFCPQVFRSDAHPSLLSRNHRMPPALNRLSWRMAALADRVAFQPVIDRCRKSLGLRSLACSTLEHLLGDRPLLAADGILAPLPPDVKRPVTRIGYPHLAGSDRLSPSLEAFLAEGPPPVYFGFGSMPYPDRRKIFLQVTAAARQANMRLVVSWGREERMDNDCYLVGSVDHGRLFPKTAMVIHHGGAGTTTTAARAGVPQVLIPHILDQFYWARRILDMGVGPAPLDRRRLSIQSLAARIRTVAADPRFRRRARQIADRMAASPDFNASLTKGKGPF
ncbi:MAG: glycosyltransferase [Desulfobacterales bacterium]|nr:glycosyltransferase [Desulfobacterales bacterium]